MAGGGIEYGTTGKLPTVHSQKGEQEQGTLVSLYLSLVTNSYWNASWYQGRRVP
jgi:hypothetical protein